ncbi:MAG: glucokinase [Solirubrobacterales bacterium]|jgi:glucokinase|nr:glucokinase [Solirubrobacterales bacterium]
MAVGVIDSDQSVLHRGTEPTTGLTLDLLLETLERELRDGLEACPEVEAIGVGIPATMQHDAGIAIHAVNLPFVNVPVRELISERFHLPVFVDNDANLAALAEQRFGAGRQARNMVLLTIGTGIGGGLVLNGELYRGTTGAGAELGHMVIDENGPPCQGNCPNHGCVEAFASGTALGRAGRLAAERDPDSALGRALAAGDEVTGKTVTDAALAGDRAAVEVVGEIGGHLGVALASYANIFEPDVIVIGGGVSAAGELLLGPARQQVRDRALAPMNETPVLAAALGPDAGMIGAAAMALEGTS